MAPGFAGSYAVAVSAGAPEQSTVPGGEQRTESGEDETRDMEQGIRGDCMGGSRERSVLPNND
ncbi:hypothetical protein BVX97_06075 [bacterium E08(2017)]|nr:hypothetical protein BVX97_06075 [bacterium E08(2017)]